MNGNKLWLILFFCIFSIVFSQPKIVPKPISIDVKTGTTELTANSKIFFSDDELDTVALLFAAELKAVHNLDLPVGKGTATSDGDVLIITSSSLTGQQYKLTVDGKVTLEVAGMDGAYPGTVTIIQAITNSEIPNMVIEDKPFRPLRTLSLDIKTKWYSLDRIKVRIKIARFYKISHVMLHTGEKQWIGSVTDQVSDYTSQQRMAHFLYTKEEMAGLIAFGRLNGVYLMPHSECTPHFNHMRMAMGQDFCPDDQYAGYADEIDGQGSFANFDGEEDNTRWRNLMKECHKRTYEQFAKGYPEGKKLPIYHIGPIASEGGMSYALGAWFFDFFKNELPNPIVGYWAMRGWDDPNLLAHRDHIYPYPYSAKVVEKNTPYLQNGYKLIASPWQPLYICGDIGHWSICEVEDVFKEWNCFRCGTDGYPDGISNSKWELFNGINDDNVMGASMATWEGRETDQWILLRPRLPAYADHAWHHKEWPYPNEDWTDFQSRVNAVDPLLDDFLKPSASEIPDPTGFINKDHGDAVIHNQIKSIQNIGRSVIITLNSRRPYTYRLMNVNGQCIRTQKGTARSINVDTRSLPMGVYVIMLKMNGVITINKIKNKQN